MQFLKIFQQKNATKLLFKKINKIEKKSFFNQIRRIQNFYEQNIVIAADKHNLFLKYRILFGLKRYKE